MKKTMFVAVAVLAIILGIVAYASAATSVGPTAVNVSASVNPKLDMSLNTPIFTLLGVASGLLSLVRSLGRMGVEKDNDDER